METAEHSAVCGSPPVVVPGNAVTVSQTRGMVGRGIVAPPGVWSPPATKMTGGPVFGAGMFCAPSGGCSGGEINDGVAAKGILGGDRRMKSDSEPSDCSTRICTGGLDSHFRNRHKADCRVRVTQPVRFNGFSELDLNSAPSCEDDDSQDASGGHIDDSVDVEVPEPCNARTTDIAMPAVSCEILDFDLNTDAVLNTSFLSDIALQHSPSSIGDTATVNGVREQWDVVPVSVGVGHIDVLERPFSESENGQQQMPINRGDAENTGYLNGGGARALTGTGAVQVVGECSQSGGTDALVPCGWKRRNFAGKGPDRREKTYSKPSALEQALMKFADRSTDYIISPEIGTEFDSSEEAYEYYNLYSWEIGFGIRIGKTRYSDNRENML